MDDVTFWLAVLLGSSMLLFGINTLFLFWVWCQLRAVRAQSRAVVGWV